MRTTTRRTSSARAAKRQRVAAARIVDCAEDRDQRPLRAVDGERDGRDAPPLAIDCSLPCSGMTEPGEMRIPAPPSSLRDEPDPEEGRVIEKLPATGDAGLTFGGTALEALDACVCSADRGVAKPPICDALE